MTFAPFKEENKKDSTAIVRDALGSGGEYS